MVECYRLPAYHSFIMTDESYSPESVGRRIALLRTALGMRQSEFADQLGLGRTELNSWEMGARRPSLAKAALILQFYPVTADWLFYGDERRMSVEMYRLLYEREP